MDAGILAVKRLDRAKRRLAPDLNAAQRREVAVLASRLRQPPIVGFIIAGILVGPQGFSLVEDPAEIELLAKIGISLLLFVVGLLWGFRVTPRDELNLFWMGLAY
jgi:NhaP-type Na+/H+ or K+/H+ antiporter